MTYIGSIKAVDGDPPISRTTWMNYIDSVEDMVRPPGRPGRNPANGEAILLRPPADTVHLILDERKIGTFSWGPHDEACVNVESTGFSDQRVVKRAIEIADSMGGVFSQWDDKE